MNFDEAWPLIDSIDGHMRPEETRWLWDMAEGLPRGARILEIGVWAARTTTTLALANPDAKVIGIDPGHKDLSKANAICKAHDVHPTVLGMRSPDDLGRLGEPFDMIFIDGNHYLNYVMRDILGAHKILKVGGLLCGHDYATIGVRLAVDMLIRSNVLQYSTPLALPVGSIWCSKKIKDGDFCEAQFDNMASFSQNSFAIAIRDLAKKEHARV